LRVQPFSAAGVASGPPRDVDPGFAVSIGWPAPLVVLPESAGYRIAWERASGGVSSRVLSPAGTELGAVQELSAAGAEGARNASLAVLDDGRVVVAWEHMPRGTRRGVLRGRFLDARGMLQGPELSFPPSPDGGDIDPVVAPGPAGGFLLAWTGNDSPSRDVFARLFDARGQPAGPVLPISARINEQDYPDLVRLADLSWVVAWEDDIIQRDAVHVRRIAPDARSLGPVRLMHALASSYNPARTGPRIAPHGAGFVAVWDDLRRSRGHDVFARVVGPGFDREDG
jgi:hypothetical protein